jgi:hypothetical protein
MKKLILAVAVAGALALGGSAIAANTPLGGTTANTDGSWTLNSSAAPFSAGLDLGLPGVTNFGDLTSLSFDYVVPSGCPTGVPKLAILTERGTINMPLPLDCSAGKHSVYVFNLTAPLDTSAILGGTALDNWSHAHSEYDNLRVDDVQIVTTGAGQSVTISNIAFVIIPGAPSPSL